MRHLVTGGAGFVGSQLVDRLLARGDEVEVLDDLSGGRRTNLAPPRLRLRLVVGSVLDPRLVTELVARAERVWHLAAVVGVPRVLADPLAAMRVNLRGSEHVLEACAAQHVPVVQFSSSEVYGDRGAERLAESDAIQPGSTERMRGSYGAAKALAEWAAAAHARRDGLEVLVVRLFNTVGPRQSAGHGMVLPRFVEQALRGGPLIVHGDGQQRRCFADVRDVVEQLLQLADRPRAWGSTFNVGADRETSILDVAELVRARAGTEVEIAHVPFAAVCGAGEVDVRRRVPDLGRARALLGGLPARPLAETVDAVLSARRAARSAGRRVCVD